MRRTSMQELSSPESLPEVDDGEGITSSRRGQIAAQACETCRMRKTRCDEHRPKCGLCTRLDEPCVYRQPRPTKRDKTQAMMMGTIQRINKKIDRILAQNPERLDRVQVASGEAPQQRKGSWPPNAPEGRAATRPEGPCVRGALSVFPWPAIQLLLAGADGGHDEDLHEILRGGCSWLVQQEMLSALEPLPADTLALSQTSYFAPDKYSTSRTVFPELTAEKMDQYADAYFGSFNMVYPVLDRTGFNESILPTVKETEFGDGCFTSLIALLVFALGVAACEGDDGTPMRKGSGIRGGIGGRPPALDIFNEARKRIGLVLSSCSLENAQAMVLTALYYETCSRHLDFWRMTVTASAAVKAVLLQGTDQDEHRADMLRRVYWVCNVIESWYYLDLNLPRSDVEAFVEYVAIPDFNNHSDFEGNPSVEGKYQYSFLSMVTLRRLIHRIMEELHDPHHFTNRNEGNQIENQTLVIAELTHQLATWRTLLPPELQWDDDMRADCSVNDKATAGQADFAYQSQHFPIIHVDILLAQMRCRYYYARFMIFRPYIYRVLHTPPDQLALTSSDTINGFIIAINSMLQWPVAYSPIRNKKRLIPNGFAWTQSFIVFLLVLRVIRGSTPLWQICERRLDTGRIEESISSMLEWIADMRQVDSITTWAWRILQPLYGLAD